MSAAGPASKGAVSRTGLQQLDMKAKQVSNDSLESTRRMLGFLEESREAGTRTLVALDTQGEQLEHIEMGVNQINSDMQEAEENLKRMKHFGLQLPFRKKSPSRSKKEDGKILSGQMLHVVDRNAVGPQSGYIPRITNDAREDEMEKNMMEISAHVGSLRQMALDIGLEVDVQNKQIEGISETVELNKERICKANQKATKLRK